MTPSRSDHFNGKTFFFPGGAPTRGLWDILRWRLTSRAKSWSLAPAVGPQPLPAAPRGDGIAVSWIGHSTFLLQTAQGAFLTDPVFSERIGPVSWAGPRRAAAPGIPLVALPKIDAILLSHDHFDHCDLPTLRALARSRAPVVVAPLNHRRLLHSAGAAARVVELDWWQAHVLPDGARLLFVPARHWCRRRLGGTNERLWGGWILEVGRRRVYFAGDSGYDPTLFREIRRRAGALDLAILPIGAYEPRWFMKEAHMDPAEAVQVHSDLGGPLSVGMHWGTFQLTDEPREAPPAALAAACRLAGVAREQFRVLELGHTLEI